MEFIEKCEFIGPHSKWVEEKTCSFFHQPNGNKSEQLSYLICSRKVKIQRNVSSSELLVYVTNQPIYNTCTLILWDNTEDWDAIGTSFGFHWWTKVNNWLRILLSVHLVLFDSHCWFYIGNIFGVSLRCSVSQFPRIIGFLLELLVSRASFKILLVKLNALWK